MENDEVMENDAAVMENDAAKADEMEGVLQRWHDAKSKLDEVSKECNSVIETCKTAVEAALAKSGEMFVITENFTVEKRNQSRESCSKKDMPSEIWEQYAKTSEYSVLTLKPLTAKA